MDSWSVTILTGRKTKRSLYAAIREASKLDFVRFYSHNHTTFPHLLLRRGAFGLPHKNDSHSPLNF